MRAPSHYPKRSPTQWRQLRQAAGEYFAAGERPATVARALNICHESARLWYHRWRADAAVPPLQPRGRRPQLGPEQLARLAAELERTALAHGYATELWTLARIADLIYQLFGVRHHPSYVFRLLRGLGWTCQKPDQRAKERDEAAIQRWVREDWPALKKGP